MEPKLGWSATLTVPNLYRFLKGSFVSNDTLNGRKAAEVSSL